MASTNNTSDPADLTTAPRYLIRRKCRTGRPLCGKTARLYAAGWRCDEHRPTAR